MSTALLKALPPVPPKSRVLDFACGSGTLSAAIVARRLGGDVDLHMLDADAVALTAARRNVPQAKRFFLCAGWPDTALAFPKRKKPIKYDWIVSNPPVHRGQPDDFSVVKALIQGARRRLRKHGILWIVAQEQVPVGRLLAVHGRCAWIQSAISEDGRFVIWSAGKRTRLGDRAGDSAASIALSSSKKKRKQEEAVFKRVLARSSKKPKACH
mmetsp:Transcript_14806/g.31383  ORF Transcript_14806/g.31383 Transcript_14806/m.31383 type:complete len:212 (-) Transcript_14806:206-841(-)